MTKVTRFFCCVSTALALCSCIEAQAELIGWDAFDSTVEGWSSRDYIGGATSDFYTVTQAIVGGHNGALSFGLATWSGTTPQQQLIGEEMGDGDDDLVVALTNVAQTAVVNGSVQFDFYANADSGGNGGGVVAPAGLCLYFTTYGGATWYYDVFLYNDQPVVAGWNTYSVDLTYGAGWDNDDGRGSDDFNSDLADAKQFGVWVIYQSWDDQAYAVDNVEIHDVPVSQVPEPGTSALLLLGAAVVARRLRRRNAAVRS
jgi:hypothetical protein